MVSYVALVAPLSPPGELPPPRRSDRRAIADIEHLIDLLRQAKTHPWSERMIGFQRRRVATFAQLLTPIEAAAVTAIFEAELERLGPPIDFWADDAAL